MPLRYRPYDAIIAPNGKAYVSHNSLTSRGFTLSVVDLRKRSLSGQIVGIAGLRTAMAEAAGHIYLTAMGVGRENRFDGYLYDIDTATDSLRELRHEPARTIAWRLLSDGRFFYLFSFTRGAAPAVPLLEVIDPATGRTVRRVARPALAPGEVPVSFAGREGTSLLFVCRSGEHRSELVKLSASFARREESIEIPGSVDEFIGFNDGIIVFLDHGSEAGVKDASLCFFSMRERKEVMKVTVSP